MNGKQKENGALSTPFSLCLRLTARTISERKADNAQPCED